MAIFELLALVVSVLGLILLWRLSADILSIRDGVLSDIYRALVQEQFAEGRFTLTGYHEGHGRGGAAKGCFVIWVWRDGEWKTRTSLQGVRPASPPPYPGAFSGDLAKTWVTVQTK